MQTTGNTILITGGSSGIGLAMAELLLKAGNEVIICGRLQSKLEEAKQKVPKLQTYVCDVSLKAERDGLYQWATSKMPNVNMLINNAGIQRETDFRSGAPELTDGESEIDTNFTGTVHLSALFLAHFLKAKTECAIVNVTSGLAFIPLKVVPAYCATKAALHSFSMSLGSQLAETNVRVFEVIPPIVQTDLHRAETSQKQGRKGISADKVAQATAKALRKDNYEITIGRAWDLKVAARLAPHFFHRLLNKLVSK